MIRILLLNESQHFNEMSFCPFLIPPQARNECVSSSPPPKSEHRPSFSSTKLIPWAGKGLPRQDILTPIRPLTCCCPRWMASRRMKVRLGGTSLTELMLSEMDGFEKLIGKLAVFRCVSPLEVTSVCPPFCFHDFFFHPFLFILLFLLLVFLLRYLPFSSSSSSSSLLLLLPLLLLFFPLLLPLIPPNPHLFSSLFLMCNGQKKTFRCIFWTIMMLGMGGGFRTNYSIERNSMRI